MTLPQQWKFRLQSHHKLINLRQIKRDAIEAANKEKEKQRLKLQRREENKAKKRLAAYEKKKAAGEIPPEMHELVPWKPPVRPIDFFVLGDICERKWPGYDDWERCVVTGKVIIKNAKMESGAIGYIWM
tara:strand:+ start:168 stop:554 length:387 start_codon:yes stop_codon:yes gene_type:complete